MPVKARDGPEDHDQGEELRRVLFKGVSVFDRSQVAPLDGVEPAPQAEPPKQTREDERSVYPTGQAADAGPARLPTAVVDLRQRAGRCPPSGNAGGSSRTMGSR
jgi:hypothetical protein